MKGEAQVQRTVGDEAAEVERLDSGEAVGQEVETQTTKKRQRPSESWSTPEVRQRIYCS